MRKKYWILSATAIMDRYRKYSLYLKEKYGEKVYKLPVKLDLTCPNRDGTVACGGCIFCHEEEGGSFENLSSRLSIRTQLEKTKEHIEKKYGAHSFIAYFQNYSNTYLPIEDFEETIQQACIEDIVQIDISTRPDCLAKEHLDILQRIKMRYNIDICIELGLQTANYHTLQLLNRGHGVADFIRAVLLIKEYGFSVCAHVILGMPWDDPTDTIETAKLLSVLSVDECKIHSMYIPKDTELARMYENDDLRLKSLDEYVEQVILFLRFLDKKIAIQRLVGRMPEEFTVFCNWKTSHWKITERIERQLQENNFMQGDMTDYLKGIILTRSNNQKGCVKMIKFVLGPSGSGKTKWLIDEANRDKKEGTGNIVFIDADDSHIFSLDHAVRLIDASDYKITTIDRLYGFLAGIVSRDHDIEKIYVDGIYEIIDLNADNLQEMADGIHLLGEETKVEFLIGMNVEREKLPENYRESAIELSLN